MMRSVRIALFAAVLPAIAGAQALTNITSLYVSYSTRKNTIKPQGELKAQLDSLDAAFFAANRQGRLGEVRRLLNKGNVLLAGKPWTDAADYAGSLVIRTERVVVDPQSTYDVRLEQLYAPTISLTTALAAHATLMQRTTATAAARMVKDFGTFEGVSRDLRESPFSMELDLSGVADGRYVISVDVVDSARALGTVTLPIAIKKGIDEQAGRLATEASSARQELRAEILFPVDRMLNVNRGRLELRTLDVDRDFAAAESVAAAVKSGKDPFAGRTGDIKRHYTLESAKEIIPFRTLVPTSYSASKAYPLIIALHGLGGTEDSFFDAYGRKLPELAEQRGYIVAAPLGYRVDGSYGWGVGTPPADYATRRREELSEADVMQVLARMRTLYRIDDNRIYLMGHSMGAIGTWKITPKYPEIWAAIGAFSGQGAPATVEKMKKIPEFVVHGDADPTVNVAGSRSMVAAMKALNMDVKYIEVPGGNHGSVVEPNLVGMFDFFDAHRKGATP